MTDTTTPVGDVDLFNGLVRPCRACGADVTYGWLSPDGRTLRPFEVDTASACAGYATITGIHKCRPR